MSSGEKKLALAEELAHYFCSNLFQEQSVKVRDQLSIYTLDTLACALAGTTAESSNAVARAILTAEGGSSTVFGTGRRASPSDAALINGAACHALELDDDHRVSTIHPGAVVVPAAFALAEATGATGMDLLRGILAGYEVGIRVGEAFEGKLFQNSFHPTSICGAFGAAAAAASILGLDELGFARAMGLAGTQASGLMEWRGDGSWTKRIHPGRAAQSGILAALLARENFSAPATIFEGANGAFQAFSHRQGVNSAALTHNLGKDFRALGTAIKPFPCCRFAHGAIDVAILANRELKGRVPRQVRVRLFATNVLTYHNKPLNAVDAQFNIPYLIAVAMLRGTVGLSDFSDTAIRQRDILSVASRTSVEEVPEFNKAYPETYITELELTMDDGTVHRWRNNCPSGDPEAEIYKDKPHEFRRQAVTKVTAILTECGFGSRADDFIHAVNCIAEAPNVKSIAEILR